MTTTPDLPALPELEVVAVVESGGRDLLVMNRPVRFLYERHGRDFIGADGPFRDFLGYSPGGGSFKAFAGRELTLNMADGTVEKVKDHWWHGILPGTVSATYGDIESLRACYVFSGGACMDPGEYDRLRSRYSGPVYPYWDYERVIKFDSMRRELWGRIFHAERRIKALINEVKKKDAALSSRASVEQPDESHGVTGRIVTLFGVQCGLPSEIADRVVAAVEQAGAGHKP